MSALLPTGVTAGYLGLVAPPGWVLMIGRTIGDASSSATERANADTAALFTLLWTSMANTEAPVSGGRGASAAADFAAHKTLTLLNPNGRAIIGKGQGNTAEGGGLGTNRVHGSSGGAETHTLTTAQMPAHTHSKSTTSTPGGASPSAGQGAGTDATGSTGGGASHPIMSPWLAINFIVKL
jgi:microcystin-dependent protein